MNNVSTLMTYDLDKIRERNPAVFNRIYRDYRGIVLNFLLARLKGNMILAEELVSETFHSAIKSAPKLKNLKNIKSWLFMIAYRRLVDHLRKNIKENHNDDFEINNVEDNFCVFNKLHLKHEDIMINNAIDKLKDKYKKVILLKYINNLTLKDISKYLGLNISAVTSLIVRAKLSLKKELNNEIRKNKSPFIDIYN